MSKKRRTGLAIGLAAACIAVLCAAGVCNGITKEEKAVRPVATTSATEVTTTTVPPTTTAPMTTTVPITTNAPSIATTAPCSTIESATATTADQITTADTTVPVTTTRMTTTASPATTAPAPTEPYNGQTSGDYIYCIGFGWVFNEGGGGYGETNDEMYCNGNKIGYF